LLQTLSDTKKEYFSAWRAIMVKRYTISSEFVFEDCLVTPSVYADVLRRFDEFIAPFISHLHAWSQQHKARDDMRGL